MHKRLATTVSYTALAKKKNKIKKVTFSSDLSIKVCSCISFWIFKSSDRILGLWKVGLLIVALSIILNFNVILGAGIPSAKEF